MSDVVLDCHHHDITHIVDARAVIRYQRKEYNRRRYERVRDSLPHVADANLLKALKGWEADLEEFKRRRDHEI